MIQRLAERIQHPPQNSLADRYLEQPAAASHRRAAAQAAGILERNGADADRIEMAWYFGGQAPRAIPFDLESFIDGRQLADGVSHGADDLGPGIALRIYRISQGPGRIAP